MEKAKKNGLVMAIYLLGIFIGAIDTGILTPARTVVQNSLGVDEKTGIWMITAFTLSYACSMPILGKLADRIGRKKVYMVAVALFGTGSFICGISNFFNSFPMLIAGRVIQAFGGGGIMPLATAEFGTSFPEEKRGVALGLVGGVYGIANILGATLGSAILDLVGTANWHWLFFINLPICVFVVLAGAIALPKGERKTAQRTDYLGTLVLVAMVLSLLYSINNLDFFKFSETIGNLNVFPFLILFAALIPVFLLVEKRAADPVFNIRYFKNRNIVLIFIMAFIVGVCLMGMVFVPQFAENALKTPEGSGGYFVTVLGLFAGIGGPLSGKLVDKYGPKIILLLGFGVSIIGALFLAVYATVHISLAGVIISLVLVGTGLGFVMGTPLNYMMLTNTKKEESNSALSALSLMRSIGTTIGPMIMIGFIAQAGIAAQDTIIDILPPVSSIQVQADAALTQEIRSDLIFVRDNIGKINEVKALLLTNVDKMEQQTNALNAANDRSAAGFEAIKQDPQFKSMLKKMDFTIPTIENQPDFAAIRQNLNSGGGIDASEIDERLKMLDFDNNSNMDFDMNKSGDLPDDVVQRLKTSSVTNIAENIVYLANRMFQLKTPSVIQDIQDGIAEGITGLQSGIDGMGGGVSGLSDGLGGMQSGVEGIATGLEGVDQGLTGMADGLKGMDKAVSGMRKGISGIRKGISGMQKARDGIEKGMAGMKQGLATMDKNIAAKKKELQKLIDAGQPPSVWGPVQGQLQGMIAGRKALKAQYTQAAAQKAKLVSGMNTMRKQISSMNAAISKIRKAKPKLTSLIGDVKAEKTYMLSLKSLMDETAAAMTELKGTLQSCVGRMQDAQGKLAQLKEQIPAYFDAAMKGYIQQLEDKKAEIETTFQNTINQGFTQMYYAVAVFCAIAMLTLVFYRNMGKSAAV